LDGKTGKLPNNLSFNCGKQPRSKKEYMSTKMNILKRQFKKELQKVRM